MKKIILGMMFIILLTSCSGDKQTLDDCYSDEELVNDVCVKLEDTISTKEELVEVFTMYYDELDVIFDGELNDEYAELSEINKDELVLDDDFNMIDNLSLAQSSLAYSNRTYLSEHATYLMNSCEDFVEGEFCIVDGIEFKISMVGEKIEFDTYVINPTDPDNIEVLRFLYTIDKLGDSIVYEEYNEFYNVNDDAIYYRSLINYMEDSYYEFLLLMDTVLYQTFEYQKIDVEAELNTKYSNTIIRNEDNTEALNTTTVTIFDIEKGYKTVVESLFTEMNIEKISYYDDYGMFFTYGQSDNEIKGLWTLRVVDGWDKLTDDLYNNDNKLVLPDEYSLLTPMTLISPGWISITEEDDSVEDIIYLNQSGLSYNENMKERVEADLVFIISNYDNYLAELGLTSNLDENIQNKKIEFDKFIDTNEFLRVLNER